MPSTDNRLTFDNDDIKDGSLTPAEMNTINNPKNKRVLAYDKNTKLFSWARIRRGRVIL